MAAGLFANAEANARAGIDRNLELIFKYDKNIDYDNSIDYLRISSGELSAIAKDNQNGRVIALRLTVVFLVAGCMCLIYGIVPHLKSEITKVKVRSQIQRLRR